MAFKMKTLHPLPPLAEQRRIVAELGSRRPCGCSFRVIAFGFAFPARIMSALAECWRACRMAKPFGVQCRGSEVPVFDVLSNRYALRQKHGDSARAERFVRVEWLDTVPREKAFNEVGLFGNQNTVCKPNTPKWRHTVERLKTVFTNWQR